MTATGIAKAPHRSTIRGFHAAVFFVLSTAALIGAGFILLPLSPQQDVFETRVAIVLISIVLLGFLFLWSISNAENVTDVYRYLFIGLLLYGPFSIFILAVSLDFLPPKIDLSYVYLTHIVIASVHLSFCSATSRVKAADSGFGVIEFFMCLTMATIFWLSLGRLPLAPWSDSISKADIAAATALRPLILRTTLNSNIASLLGLRIASVAISLTVFCVVAMAHAIKDGHSQIPSSPKIPTVDFGNAFLLKPVQIFLNGFILALNRILSLVWHIGLISVFYFSRWFIHLITLLRKRIILSGIFKGLFKSVVCYAIWLAFIVIARAAPNAAIRYIETPSGDFGLLVRQVIWILGTGIAGILLLHIMVHLEPTSHHSLVENMQYGISWLLMSIVFAAFCLRVAMWFGLITSSGFFQFGPFLIISGLGIVGIIAPVLIFKQVSNRNKPA